MLGRHLYILSDGQKWNTRLLKRYVAPTTWSELVSAMSLPVPGNPEMDTEGSRGAGNEDLEGNRETQMRDTDDAPAAEVQRDGAMHERDHEAILGRRYPDQECMPPDCYSPVDFRRSRTSQKREEKN